MCDRGHDIETVRLRKCDHGTFHLNVGPVTMHLTSRELQLIGRVIERWAETHDEWAVGGASNSPEPDVE